VPCDGWVWVPFGCVVGIDLCDIYSWGWMASVSFVSMPIGVFYRIWRILCVSLVLVWVWKLLALMSLKLIKFLVAVGAKIADSIWIVVPLGKVTTAGPCPASIWFWPDIVVNTLLDGVMDLKYFLSLSIVWDVPLSTMQLIGSSSV